MSVRSLWCSCCRTWRARPGSCSIAWCPVVPPHALVLYIYPGCSWLLRHHAKGSRQTLLEATGGTADGAESGEHLGTMGTWHPNAPLHPRTPWHIHCTLHPLRPSTHAQPSIHVHPAPMQPDTHVNSGTHVYLAPMHTQHPRAFCMHTPWHSLHHVPTHTDTHAHPTPMCPLAPMCAWHYLAPMQTPTPMCTLHPRNPWHPHIS